jgi:hypothetical protein
VLESVPGMTEIRSLRTRLSAAVQYRINSKSDDTM